MRERDRERERMFRYPEQWSWEVGYKLLILHLRSIFFIESITFVFTFTSFLLHNPHPRRLCKPQIFTPTVQRSSLSVNLSNPRKKKKNETRQLTEKSTSRDFQISSTKKLSWRNCYRRNYTEMPHIQHNFSEWDITFSSINPLSDL